MAAPVYDESGAMVLSLTAIGPTAMFDTRLDGSVALSLTAAAQACRAAWERETWPLDESRAERSATRCRSTMARFSYEPTTRSAGRAAARTLSRPPALAS